MDPMKCFVCKHREVLYRSLVVVVVVVLSVVNILN